MFLQIHIHMNSYFSKNYAILPVPSHNIFKIWLGIDTMASKDTQRRLVKENKNRPRDPNVLVVTRGVYMPIYIVTECTHSQRRPL